MTQSPPRSGEKDDDGVATSTGLPAGTNPTANDNNNSNSNSNNNTSIEHMQPPPSLVRRQLEALSLTDEIATASPPPPTITTTTTTSATRPSVPFDNLNHNHDTNHHSPSNPLQTPQKSRSASRRAEGAESVAAVREEHAVAATAAVAHNTCHLPTLLSSLEPSPSTGGISPTLMTPTHRVTSTGWAETTPDTTTTTTTASTTRDVAQAAMSTLHLSSSTLTTMTPTYSPATSQVSAGGNMSSSSSTLVAHVLKSAAAAAAAAAAHQTTTTTIPTTACRGTTKGVHPYELTPIMRNTSRSNTQDDDDDDVHNEEENTHTNENNNNNNIRNQYHHDPTTRTPASLQQPFVENHPVGTSTASHPPPPRWRTAVAESLRQGQSQSPSLPPPPQQQHQQQPLPSYPRFRIMAANTDTTTNATNHVTTTTTTTTTTTSTSSTSSSTWKSPQELQGRVVSPEDGISLTKSQEDHVVSTWQKTHPTTNNESITMTVVLPEYIADQEHYYHHDNNNNNYHHHYASDLTMNQGYNARSQGAIIMGEDLLQGEHLIVPGINPSSQLEDDSYFRYDDDDDEDDNDDNNNNNNNIPEKGETNHHYHYSQSRHHHQQQQEVARSSWHQPDPNPMYPQSTLLLEECSGELPHPQSMPLQERAQSLSTLGTNGNYFYHPSENDGATDAAIGGSGEIIVNDNWTVSGVDAFMAQPIPFPPARKCYTFTNREQYEEAVAVLSSRQHQQHEQRDLLYPTMANETATPMIHLQPMLYTGGIPTGVDVLPPSSTSRIRIPYQPSRRDEEFQEVGKLPEEELRQIFIERRREPSSMMETHRTGSLSSSATSSSGGGGSHTHHRLMAPIPLQERQSSIPSIHWATHVNEASYTENTEDDESTLYARQMEDDGSLSSRGSSLYLPDQDSFALPPVTILESDRTDVTATTSTATTTDAITPRAGISLGPSFRSSTSSTPGGAEVLEEGDRTATVAGSRNLSLPAFHETPDDSIRDQANSAELVDETGNLDRVAEQTRRQRKRALLLLQQQQQHEQEQRAMDWLHSVEADQNVLAEAASSKFLTGRGRPFLKPIPSGAIRVVPPCLSVRRQTMPPVVVTTTMSPSNEGTIQPQGILSGSPMDPPIP